MSLKGSDGNMINSSIASKESKRDPIIKNRGRLLTPLKSGESGRKLKNNC